MKSSQEKNEIIARHMIGRYYEAIQRNWNELCGLQRKG
jgi:hypothetical protein